MANTYFDTAKITGQVDALVPIIDDFEDQDFSEYVGDTGAASITTSPVANGSFAAAIADGENEIRSTSGLANYPSQGDVFRWQTYIPSGGSPRFYWGVQDANNYYYLEYDDANGEWSFVKVDGGTSTTLVLDTTVTFDTGAYSETEVEWRTNGRHLITYFDSGGTKQGSIDYTDDTFTSGGVGWGEWSADAVTTGLVSWWKFDAGSGSTATDYEDGNDGTINGATWDTRNKTGGYSLQFDGTDDFVSLPDLGLTETESFTITLWINYDVLPSNSANGRDDLFAKFNSSGGELLTIEALDDDTIRLLAGNTNGTLSNSGSSSALGSKNTWYHIAGRYDAGAGELKVYIDGTGESSSSASPGDFTTSGGPYIGARSDGSDYVDGLIDDVRYYNTALSDSDIQQIYDNTK